MPAFGRSRNSSAAPGAAVGTAGGTDLSHLGSRREVKPARDCQLCPISPPARRFQAPQKRRCQGPWRHALATSTYLARAVPTTGILQARQHVGSVRRAQDAEGAVVGVKPNKPNATDYQQPPTAREAPRKPPTNTVGTRRDRHRKSLTQFTPMELQIRGAPIREDTCYNYSHLNFITKFTLYITFWTNFLPSHDQHSRQHSLAWVATSHLGT